MSNIFLDMFNAWITKTPFPASMLKKKKKERQHSTCQLLITEGTSSSSCKWNGARCGRRFLL